MSDLVDDLRAMQAKLDAMPPRVSRFYASHSVPYGRVFRMWTTRGDLIAYVNRGEVADMPRAPKSHDFAGVMGIPIYFE